MRGDGVGEEERTLMPSAARRSRLVCWVSLKVRLLRPLKMMGSARSKPRVSCAQRVGEKIKELSCYYAR